MKLKKIFTFLLLIFSLATCHIAFGQTNYLDMTMRNLNKWRLLRA